MTDTKRYRAVVGLTLADGTVVEPGGAVTDPAPWLVDQGKVELVKKRKGKR